MVESNSMDHHLILHPTGKFGPRGEVYHVLLNGEMLATGASPEFSACRELEKRGMAGDAYFWRLGKLHWDMRIAITKGAQKSVMENAKNGPRFAKWKPFEEPTQPAE